ncbi:hypothetical protein VULLAG_LOCUS5091 [Vulpes lagopus]
MGGGKTKCYPSQCSWGRAALPHHPPSTGLRPA